LFTVRLRSGEFTERSPRPLGIRGSHEGFKRSQSLGKMFLGSLLIRTSEIQFGNFKQGAPDLPACPQLAEEVQGTIKRRSSFSIFSSQAVDDAPGALSDRKIKPVAVALSELLELRNVLPQGWEISALNGGFSQESIYIMLVRHGAVLDRLAGSFKGGLHILIDKGELAPGPEGQGASVKLVALPLIGHTGNGNHVIV
jgi:hypothetical protein